MQTKKARRQKEAKKRKNFLPTLLLTLLLWSTLGFLTYFVDPENLGVIPLFFLITLLALTFTFSIILANSRRGLLTSIGLTLFLILRYFGVGNILNLALITGIALTIEMYFTKTRG